MKRSAALAEARRRWGKHAHIETNSLMKRVGELKQMPFPHFDIYGQGSTWEEAFAEADKRQLKKQKAAPGQRLAAQ